MTEPIISINDLSVYFNKKKAINNVTMDFYPNEITALIGPSGSGTVSYTHLTLPTKLEV